MKLIEVLAIMVVLLFTIINNSNRYAQTITKIMLNIEDKNLTVLKYHEIKDDELFGQLQINTIHQAKFVRIIATYFDQNREVIEINATYPEHYILKPNMKVLIEISFDEVIVNKITSYDLTIT